MRDEPAGMSALHFPPRWEYMRLSERLWRNEPHMDDLGAAGWEAVGFSPQGFLLMKRPQ